MPLSKEKIQEIVSKYGKHQKDTGSTVTQIMLLTERINQLQKHFFVHKKDLLTRRNFLRLIGRRKRLLDYLKRTEPQKYEEIIKEIKLE